MKNKLVEELIDLLNNMDGAVSGSSHIHFVELLDGRTAEVTISITTDEDDFILDPDNEQLFVINGEVSESDLD